MLINPFMKKVAEYFRDQEGQDVLLFIDNIFRFVILTPQLNNC